MTGERAKEAKKLLLSMEAWHPFPKYEQREAWESLPSHYREHYLSEEGIRRVLSYVPKPLLATDYMVLYRTGACANPYQTAFYERKTRRTPGAAKAASGWI